jgi:hypothetical protein
LPTSILQTGIAANPILIQYTDHKLEKWSLQPPDNLCRSDVLENFTEPTGHLNIHTGFLHFRQIGKKYIEPKWVDRAQAIRVNGNLAGFPGILVKGIDQFPSRRSIEIAE